MKDRSYFLREDLQTYKKKYFLICNPCHLISYLCKVKEQKPHKQRIKITEL